MLKDTIFLLLLSTCTALYFFDLVNRIDGGHHARRHR